ncbi:tetratricopeptide repeat protein [Nocardia fluminea]|uniref:tetratricopeptide repeat protein n=1 Tax=Nocardia fluminea TaxID=134984 RepID=UPI0037F26416
MNHRLTGRWWPWRRNADRAGAGTFLDLEQVSVGRDFHTHVDNSHTVHHHWNDTESPPSASAETTGLVIGPVPRPARHFVPRAQVGQLREALAREQVAVVVCGMRGAGKTQVAAAYAREIMSDESAGLVGWVGAETRDSTLAGLAEIATQLKVADPDGDSLISARRLRDHLNSARGLEGVLVFDNATGPDFLSEFLPTGGGVRVVITSTDRAFAGLGELVDAATGFDRTESLGYLHAATGLDDPTGSDILATEMGDLPLALAAAVATITAQRLDYDSYQELLAAQPLPAALPHQPVSYGRAVDQALGLAIDTVITGDTALDGRVRWLVGVMAMLSADGVEAALLEKAPDPLTGAAITRCVEGSLVSWSTGRRVLVMHRLTARVVRERAFAAGTLDTIAADTVAVLAPHLFDLIEAFQRRSEGARLVDHIDTLAAVATGPTALSVDTHAAILTVRRWATNQLVYAADLQRAIPHAEHTVTDHQHRLAPDHPATLIARGHLAGAYQRAGRVSEAIELLEQLLTDLQRLIGDDHPNTLTARHNLASAYQRAGRVSEAIDLFEQLLTDRERLLGENHPDTLSTRSYLTSTYQEAGRVTEAIELFEQLLTDRERLLGENHPDTLSTRSYLASAYQHAGRVTEAIELLEQLLTDRERLIGDDHPDTLSTRHNLASAYQHAGRVTEAIELLEQLLTDNQRLIGDDHPDTLSTRNNLASAYQRAGRVSEAIELFEQLLTDRERLLDENHPDTLAARNNLAYTYQRAGRVSEAIELFEQLLTDHQRLLDDDHPHTLATRNNLASAYQDAGRVDEAIRLQSRKLAD